MRSALSALGLLVTAVGTALPAAPPGPGESSNDRLAAHKVLKDRGPAVVKLQGFGDGKEIPFTGFLYGDGKVVTVAHGVRRSGRIDAVIPGLPGLIECWRIDSDDDTDLAVLSLRANEQQRRALAAADRKLNLFPAGADPAAETLVVMLGHPHKMDLDYGYGHIHKLGNSRGVLLHQLGIKPEQLDLPTPTLSARAAGVGVFQIRLSSAVGSSGAPYLNTDGQVLAVHWGGASPRESTYSFGTPSRYIRDLKFDNPPQRLHDPGRQAQPLAEGRITTADFRPGPQQRPAAPAPAEGPDLRCHHRGPVPPSAELVYQAYIGDKTRFARFIRKAMLDELLGRHEAVLHVVNLALRFNFLIPCCYDFQQTISTAPEGTHVELRMTEPPDQFYFIPAEFRAIRLLAWRLHAPVAGAEPAGKDYAREAVAYGRRVARNENAGANRWQALDPRRLPADARATRALLQSLSEAAPENLFRGMRVHPAGTRPGPNFGPEDVVIDPQLTDPEPVSAADPGVARRLVAYQTLSTATRAVTRVVVFSLNNGVVVVSHFAADALKLQAVTSAPPVGGAGRPNAPPAPLLNPGPPPGWPPAPAPQFPNPGPWPPFAGWQPAAGWPPAPPAGGPGFNGPPRPQLEADVVERLFILASVTMF